MIPTRILYVVGRQNVRHESLGHSYWHSGVRGYPRVAAAQKTAKSGTGMGVCVPPVKKRIL